MTKNKTELRLKTVILTSFQKTQLKLLIGTEQDDNYPQSIPCQFQRRSDETV